MKGKSILGSIIILVIALAGLYSASMPESWKIWLGVIAFVGTAALATFPQLTSGQPEPGWSTVTWIAAGLGVTVQLMNYFGDNNILPPSIVNMIVGTITLIITIFLKDYGKGGVTTNKVV